MISILKTMESIASLPIIIWITHLCVVIAFFLLLYSFISPKNTNLSKNRKHVPEAAGRLPLIGHLPLLSGPDLSHITLSNLSEKHGPIFGIRLGIHRAIVVNSCETAKECLTGQNDQAFSRRPETAALYHMGYKFAMFAFNSSGSYWREMRKIAMTKLLSNQKVAMLKNAREIEARAFIRNLLENNDGPVEMKERFGDMTFDFMVRTVAGGPVIEKGIESGERERWREVLGEFLKMMNVLSKSDAFPFLRWFDDNFGEMHKRLKRTGEVMDGFLQNWLDDNKERRRGKRDVGGVGVGQDIQGEGFMEQMLEVSDLVAKEFDDLNFDADTINKATCQTMMLGGTETTAITLTWALSCLLNNRDALRRAQDELDEIVGRKRHVKESDLDQLVYLQAILKETMRLHPPAAILVRESIEDCEIGGFHVPAGTRLFFNAWQIQRDPKVWPEPSKFKPERFLTSHKEIDVRGQHYELIPFGGGRRVCPGVSFSLPLMQLALASFLHSFDVTTPGDEPVDMTASFGATNVKASPLLVLVTPRLSPEIYA